MFCTIPFFIVPSAPTTTGITSVFICQILCISSSRFLLCPTPSKYNQSCGKHYSQNMHSFQQHYFLHLANHTTSRYLLNILVQQWHSCAFISHILDTSISRSLHLGSSSNSFVVTFMSDGMVMSWRYNFWWYGLWFGLVWFSPTAFWLEFIKGVSMS